MSERSRRTLRNRIADALPRNHPVGVYLRSLVTVGEFLLTHPGDALAGVGQRPRTPGLRRLHILFRHVHLKHHGRSRDPNKTRPPWFSHERCFENLVKTIDRSPYAGRVSLTIVYDGSAEELASDFVSQHQSTPKKFEFTTMLVNGGSNIKSWLRLLDFVERGPIPDDDVLYFLENDYLHVEDWLDKVVELFESRIPFDYLSLHDATDFYEMEHKETFPPFRGLRPRLDVTGTHHWREAPSAYGTFLVPRRIFVEDLGVWRSRLSDFYAFTYLRLIKRRVLVSPVPGLATHCMAGSLTPTIDWATR
jgi:hypothetical protein